MNEIENFPFLQEASIETLALLKSYQKWNIGSRTFMLKEHGRMLEDIRANKGNYQNYSQEAKLFLESRIYVELLERLCQVIEDFASIAYALWGELKDIPISLVSQPNPQNIFKQFTPDKWDILLRNAEINLLPISPDEKAVLENVRRRNTDSLDAKVKLIVDFLDLYWVFYTKHKHGNTLMFGFETAEIEGEPTIFVPAFYNKKSLEKVTGILVNYSIYCKWKALFDFIIIISKDIVDITVEFIERGGTPFVVKNIYCELTSEENNTLQSVSDQQNATVTKVNINVKVNSEISPETIKKHLDLYKRF